MHTFIFLSALLGGSAASRSFAKEIQISTGMPHRYLSLAVATFFPLHCTARPIAQNCKLLLLFRPAIEPSSQLLCWQIHMTFERNALFVAVCRLQRLKVLGACGIVRVYVCALTISSHILAADAHC